MKFMITLFLSLTIILSVITQTFGQENISSRQLNLKNGIVEVNSNLDAIRMNGFHSSRFFNGHYHYILIFDNIPDVGIKKDLELEGIELFDYIPESGYFASLTKNVHAETLSQFGIVSVVDPGKKVLMAPRLYNQDYPEWSLSGNGLIDLNVLVYADHQSQKIKEDLGKYADLILDINKNLYTIRTKIDNISLLLDLPYVKYIDNIAAPPVPDDTEGKSLHRSNALNAAYNGGRKYDGTGVHVAIADDGAIGPHIDFRGRLTQYTTALGGSHGDMTSGILMGAGNLNPRMKGMATGAYMHLYSITGYPHIVGADTNLLNLGTVITSTSYSQGCGGEYTVETQAIDQQIRQNPSLIHVFSAGNSGYYNCGYGAGSGWGNITGGYKAGKNVIATANLDNIDNLQTSSSRGPAQDGRIKPDIAANGYNQMSTDQDNTYQVGGGTSAASPGIAGVLAQLYDAYRQENSGSNPESPLMKAALLNTAEDLQNTGPDYESGWGRVNALRAVRLIEEKRYLDSVIGQNDSLYHTLFIPSNVKEVKIMLYWLDYEGSPTAGKALVNNLDIKVLAPDSNEYLPWILDPTPNSYNLSQPATKGRDSLNNMEQVSILNPSTGLYILFVKGFQVPQGPQKYYIVYDFLYDEIEITYPIGGEGFVPGETEFIRWDAYGNSSPFVLSYSLNNGSTWNTISNNIAASQRWASWVVPGTLSSDARIRVDRGSQVDINDTNFTIIGLPQNISVDKACPDSFNISWSALTGAAHYEILKLGNKYMDSIGITSDTTFTLTNVNPTDEYWISIRAIDSSGAKGRRANAVYKTPGVWNCPLNLDAEISGIISPAEGTYLNCQDYSMLDVKVYIKNNGTNPVSGFQVYYQLDNGNIVSENFNDTLAAGDSAAFTFNSTLDISALGDYSLNTWLTLQGDGNKYNDSLIHHLKMASGILVSPDTSESFQDMNLCSTDSDCEATICPLSNGYANAENLLTDDIDWRVNLGSTPSNNTGPSYDHTMGTNVGRYIYLEASNGCEGKEAMLISPCIDLNNTFYPELEFWFNMYGMDMGSLHVDILVGAEYDMDVIPAISGHQGSSWQSQTVDLSPYNGKTINIRFRGITGSGYRSDIALDDITIRETSAAAILENRLENTRIYPNPASKQLFIETVNNLTSGSNIEIRDISGKLVYSKKEHKSRILKINIADLSPGIYSVQLRNEDAVFFDKIVIMK